MTCTEFAGDFVAEKPIVARKVVRGKPVSFMVYAASRVKVLT